MRQLYCTVIASFLFVFASTYTLLSNEENFLLVDGETKERLLELGPHVYERITPCSTFKIALSLMGYDAEILKDEKTPEWDFQEGYVNSLESWKVSQTPQSWVKNSCVWYSQLLAVQLGLGKIQNYVKALEYGNQDMSGGLTSAWLSASLKISPAEQVDFIQKMIHGKLPVSSSAIQMTKSLLYVEELSEGWKLFGKTGLGFINEGEGLNLEAGWFVGWFEKEGNFFPFAYHVRGIKIDPAQRIPRVKQLFMEPRINLG